MIFKIPLFYYIKFGRITKNMISHTQGWLISLSTHYTVWVYIFIVLFAFAEGPFLSMVFGVIIRLGYFGIVPVYLALMAGDLIGDVFWYYLGHFYGHSFIRKFGKYFNVNEQSVEKVKIIFHKHKHPILFISKITNGFGFALATLMTAGMVKIPFRRYIAINILGQFIWTGLLMSIGYFFGNFYLAVNAIFGKIFIIGIFIILLIALMRYQKYLQNKIKNLNNI